MIDWIKKTIHWCKCWWACYRWQKKKWIIPVLYHRAYAEYLEFVHTCEMAHVAVPTFECWKNLSPPFVCFYCEQPIVPPTRWLPVPGELQKKLCSKCYE
jgi:hypothetical protein